MAEETKLEILIANLGTDSKSTVSDKDRQALIENFFSSILKTRPHFVFAQEAKISENKTSRITVPGSKVNQIDYVKTCLGNETHVYSTVEVEEFKANPIIKTQQTKKKKKINTYNPYSVHNVIFWNEALDAVKTISLEGEFEIQFQLAKKVLVGISYKRFQVCKLTRANRAILLVNFHGEQKMLADEKMQSFRVYLQFFQKIKIDEGCDYLVIAGDFNFNLTKLETDKKNKNFLESLELMVVPYERQRKNNANLLKEKVDGLICSKALWKKGQEVAVYHDIAEEKELATVDGNCTRVVPSKVPQDVLDHDPILFTLWIPEAEPEEGEGAREGQGDGKGSDGPENKDGESGRNNKKKTGKTESEMKKKQSKEGPTRAEPEGGEGAEASSSSKKKETEVRTIKK